MLRLLLLNCAMFFSLISMSKTILVKNLKELSNANKDAKPGDVVILENGEWNNVIMVLNCNGTKEQPITFKAQNQGQVLITGNSKLQLGGRFIIVDGLYFANGYAGADAIIKFCIDKKQLANNCRVTNTVINDFNNPKRLDENYWVAFYGKNNRLDHCSFLNKNNIAVLLAVILEDERSRENFHSIDHNYFGLRLPLASNGGEIIRVGVSEHCEFNSNTQILDNFFENCDGEGEIISIKSCQNIIRNNLFKECQGAVVLRHGNFNTVENNIFYGNNKEGTGGVRIINKGQWVVNNFFYKCRGEGFRSPLTIMNGVPNSPANRYLEVSEAVICNNSFFDCTSIGFCEGSDTERSAKPHNVKFLNNIFYNTKHDQLYNIYDNISGISFSGNLVNKKIEQSLINGFIKTSLTTQKVNNLMVPAVVLNSPNSIDDSLLLISRKRIFTTLSSKQGISDIKQLQYVMANAASCGTKWFNPNNYIRLNKIIKVNCKTVDEIIQQLAKNNNTNLIINLTGKEYIFNSPLNISNNVSITSTQKQSIKFSLAVYISVYFIQLKAGNTLVFKNLNLDLSSANANTFITTDTSGSSNHCNFIMSNCSINNYTGTFFNAFKSSVSDSIKINNCSFSNNMGDVFKFLEETDKKGYYNVEKLKITNCTFSNSKGKLLAMLRTGNDESTMGPLLLFSNNKINNCFTENDEALINIYGTQRSIIEKNLFTKSNTGKTLILFEDAVRALHLFNNNRITGSGKTITNKFVKSNNNIIQ